LAQRQTDIAAVLALLASLGNASLTAEVKSLAAGLESYGGCLCACLEAKQPFVLDNINLTESAVF
jgi:hypothetical protein